MGLMARRGQPSIATTKGLDVTPESGVQHAKPVPTRPPKLGLGDELARLVDLGWSREIQPPARRSVQHRNMCEAADLPHED